MNEIDIDSSCYFIYQNASLNTKSEIGRAKFTRQLNKFTNNAAIEEKCEGKYKSFNDVIKYDDSTDAHCFPGLWKGGPPMAPVNPGYSNTAQSLKMHFIDSFDNSTHNLLPTGLPITAFSVRMSELWEVLLKENFVFSFRNTKEISLYTSIEVEYIKWTRSFIQNVTQWESVAINEIDLASLSSVSQLRKTIITELVDKVKQFYEIAKAKMDKYFADKQGIVVKWKHDFELKLHHQRNNLYQYSMKRLNNVIETKKVFNKL